jgi:peptidyl-prolyl cis-trans isomerase C
MIESLILTLALVPTNLRQPAADPIVASAGTVQITAADVRQVMVARRLSGDPQQMLSTLTVDGRESIARSLLETSLLALEARRLAIDKDPEVQRALRWTIDKLLAEELARRDLATVDTSDAALQAYYTAHDSQFRTRARVKARHIVVKTRDEAEAARAEVVAGSPFEQVASRLNIDPSRDKGGDLGWVPKGIMVKPFEDGLFALRAGELSAVIQTSFGFHVVRAEEVDPGQLQPFDTVKDDVKQRVLSDRLEALKARIAGTAAVTVDRDALAKVGK